MVSLFIESPDWLVEGSLPLLAAPSAEAVLDEDLLAALDEDLVTATSPDEQLLLDVGWYPSGDPEGSFVCRAVPALPSRSPTRYDWAAPVARLETRDTATVLRWLADQIAAYTKEQTP